MTAKITDLRSHKHKPITFFLTHVKCGCSVSASLLQLLFSYSFCITSYILFYLLIIRLFLFNIWYWDVFPKKIHRRQCSFNKLLYWVINSAQSRWWYKKRRSSPETMCDRFVFIMRSPISIVCSHHRCFWA